MHIISGFKLLAFGTVAYYKGGVSTNLLVHGSRNFNQSVVNISILRSLILSVLILSVNILLAPKPMSTHLFLKRFLASLKLT